ncbi:MAG: 3D domain-containing protein [Candidatus Staskawiczbacteria bacterium]|nr:3D domain-containing protein [Candidatus Staskawiczbacteria bacterium]
MNNIINTIRKTAFGEFSHLIGSMFAVIVIGVCLLGILVPNKTIADSDSVVNASYVAKNTNVGESTQKVVKTIQSVMTAYSSTPDQTDDTPFITASGKRVADGIIANNGLPFGTKVRIPKLFGDKIFIVQDRMNRRMGSSRFDIWMPDRQSALNFGVKKVDIEVIEEI